MKKFYVLVLSILVCVTSVFAGQNVRGEQEAIKAGHWVYDSLACVMQDFGITHFYDYAPLTVQEVNIMLSEVDYEKLSCAGKIQYDKIKEYFAQSKWALGSKDFNLGLELTITPEGQYKSNNNLDWIFSYTKRSNFIEADFGLQVFKYVFLGTDISIAQSKSARIDNDNYVNVPYSGHTVDLNFPHDSYMIAGFLFNENCGFNFRLSTLNQALGRSNTGSVIFSENMTDTPNAALKLFSPWIQFCSNITMLGMNRYMYMNTLGIRPHKKFTISIMEGALPYGTFDLRYMIPFSVYHGYAGWWDYKEQKLVNGEQADVASYLGIALNFTPVRHLRIYSNFALNQFQMPNEPDKTIPNGYAAQLGIESYIPTEKGFVHLNLEGTYAAPYFMINESPNWSFVKTYKETCDGSNTFYEWIGTPYGPDTVGIKFNCGYEVVKKWAVDVSYLFLARGELSRPNFCGWGGYDYSFFEGAKNDAWCYPKSTNLEKYKNGSSFTTPSGTPEFYNALSVKGELWALDWLCITAYPGFSFAFNSHNQKDKFDIGVEMALSVKCFFTRIKN